MYFLSEIDPNYRIKGSRDPLGFQSLWASAGRKAIKHLSTVSVNLRDFMILCYGIHLYGDRDSRGFISFFIRFEQLCAYARRLHNNELSFNGADYINKKIVESEYFISLTDTILSNQRSYGIYGKYIRPLRDMGITNDSDFKEIMENALSKTDRKALMNLIAPLFERNDHRKRVISDDLVPVASLIKTLTEDEKKLFRSYILKVPKEEHPQNNLYNVIKNNQEIVSAPFQLYPIIQSIISTQEVNEELKLSLINIENTDKVLHPLNLIFTHLLSKPQWTTEEIINETVFRSLPGIVNYDFKDETVRKLNGVLELPINEMSNEIIARNEEVCKGRGNKAWIEIDKKIIKVLYGENGQKITEISNEGSYGFSYFINTYLNLFKQIETA
jgi:hypothetical protein